MDSKEPETVYKVVKDMSGVYVSCAARGPWSRVYKTAEGKRPWVDASLAFRSRSQAVEWVQALYIECLLVVEAEAYGVRDCGDILCIWDFDDYHDTLLDRLLQESGISLYQFLSKGLQKKKTQKVLGRIWGALPPYGTVVCQRLRIKENE